MKSRAACSLALVLAFVALAVPATEVFAETPSTDQLDHIGRSHGPGRSTGDEVTPDIQTTYGDPDGWTPSPTGRAQEVDPNPVAKSRDSRTPLSQYLSELWMRIRSVLAGSR